MKINITDNDYHFCFYFYFGAMTRMDNTATAEKTKDNAPYPLASDRQISSRTLLGAEGRVVIEHDGQRYLLRQTHAGKLILTK